MDGKNDKDTTGRQSGRIGSADSSYAVCPRCNGNGREKPIGWITYACQKCNGCGIVLKSNTGSEAR